MGDVPASPFRATVRIRHRAPLIGATVQALEAKRWSVRTDTPVWAVAPGQAAVLYDGHEVLGGGRIAVAARNGVVSTPNRDPILTRS